MPSCRLLGARLLASVALLATTFAATPGRAGERHGELAVSVTVVDACGAERAGARVTLGHGCTPLHVTTAETSWVGLPSSTEPDGKTKLLTIVIGEPRAFVYPMPPEGGEVLAPRDMLVGAREQAAP